jgi:hypothetical protein
MINYIHQDDDEPNNSTICQVQGFGMIWFEHSQSIWATLIAYSISQNVVNYDKKVEKTSMQTRLIYIFLGYISPLGLSIFAYEENMIGPSGNWCWVKINEKIQDGTGYTYVMIFYGIMWLLFFISVFFICKVVHFLNNLYISEDEKELIYKYTSRLRIFPLIQMLTLIPCTINRTLNYHKISNGVWAKYLIVILISSQGFLYAIVYGFNPKVRGRLGGFIEKYIFCIKQQNSLSLISLNTEVIDYSDISLCSSKKESI